MDIGRAKRGRSVNSVLGQEDTLFHKTDFPAFSHTDLVESSHHLLFPEFSDSPCCFCPFWLD